MLAVDHVVAFVAPFQKQNEKDADREHHVEAFMVDKIDDRIGGYFPEITHGRPLQA